MVAEPKGKKQSETLVQKSPAEFFAENKNIAGFDNVRSGQLVGSLRKDTGIDRPRQGQTPGIKWQGRKRYTRKTLSAEPAPPSSLFSSLENACTRRFGSS